MMLTINKEPNLPDDTVDIKYRELTAPLSQIIDICNQGKQMLFGNLDDKKCGVDINDVLYIEWVDTHSCICTAGQVYTSPQTLAQFETELTGKDFIRISKPMLVNIRKVRWVSPAINMKLLAELSNGEKVSVNRRYRGDMLRAIYQLGKEVTK